MKLKEQLKLLKGYQVKLGSKMSFIYCEICDDNIENILLEIQKTEYDRIVDIRDKTKENLKNFDQLWKLRKERRIELLEKQQKSKLDLEIRRKIKASKNRAKNKRISFTERDEEYIRLEVEKEWKKTFDEQLKELIEKTNDDRKEHYILLTRRYNNYKNYVKNYIPFLEREVLEVYDSILEENCKIVRFSGNELGKYWDREEYNKDMKRKGKL